MLSPGVKRLILGGKKVVAADSATTLWASAVQSAGGAAPSNARLTVVDTLIRGMKTAANGNLFAACDRLWVLGFADADTHQAQVDIVARQSWTQHGVANTLDANGFAGDGATGYLDTNVGLASGGFNATINSTTILTYINNNRTTDATVETMGANDGAAALLIFPKGLYLGAAADTFGSSINSGASGPFMNVVTARGLSIVTRTSSTACAIYKWSTPDGAINTTASVAVGALQAATIFIGGRNNGGSLFRPSADQHLVAGIASGWSAGNASDFSTLINTTMTSLGKNAY